MDAKENINLKGKMLDYSNKGIYIGIKRVLDIIFSGLALFGLSPFLLIIGLIIYFDGSGGSIIFTQERVGIKGETFKMYKFRSMYPDAEERIKDYLHLNEIDGKMFKIKNDPRITGIGNFIRAHSIDELPQIINVLKGEMSLIGPRPPLVSEYEMYDLYEQKRLYVKPGITGLWQVSGRNSLSFNEMVSLDMNYIETISFKKDALIFFKTILVVIMKDNAY